MRTRPLLVALVLGCTALVTLDAGARSPFDPLRSAVAAVLGPVESAVGSAASAVGRAGDSDELRRLREENARLRGDGARAQAARRVADEWEALLGLQTERSWSLLPARATAAGGAFGFERTVTLDVGARDGVRAGSTVVTGAGLVGRAVRVAPFTSVVLLVDDPTFGVGARLATTGALGLASGDGPGRVRWVQVDPGEVAAGAVLLTSGAGTFVADVPVGRVTGARPGPGGLGTVADVEPVVDLGRLDVVGVVLDPPRSEPRPSLP